ncbi:MAG: transglutaminase family protein [Verrucomicrobiota bacterium]
MKLRVLHRTEYLYHPAVRSNTNALHLEPRDFQYQTTLSAFLRILPTVRLKSYADLFQNRTHHFEVEDPHTRLVIESRITVATRALEIPAEVRELSLQALPGKLQDDFLHQFLQPSTYVDAGPEIWRQAIDLREDRGTTTVFQAAEDLMRFIYKNFEYQSGATNVHTRMTEVLEGRAGVCQDFAHVFIGLARALQIPARYASGYLYNGERGTLRGAQASHAWAEVFLPGLGWLGFDPTNNTLADERYVKVAIGRDYDDVAPIKGGFRGGHSREMKIKVLVEKAP